MWQLSVQKGFGACMTTTRSNTKLKILYLRQILEEETDATHGLTMTQIIERLNEYGISAERKSIYADLDALREFDIDVKTYPRNPVEYAIERKGFSLSELMLMVDAVQSCKAITAKQAKMLITNIKTLASNYEQEKLNRNIHVVGRVRSKNDSVFSNVDIVHEAMREHYKIDFSYYRTGADGERYDVLKGKKHVVTPVGITYEDGFYYLDAWNDKSEGIRTYRLDRMERVHVLKNEPATRNDVIANFRYDNDNTVKFGQFDGEKVTVMLSVKPENVEIIIDRFGDAATFVMSKNDSPKTVKARVKIYKSNQFFGWIAGMNGVVKITKPKKLAKEYRNYLKRLIKES